MCTNPILGHLAFSCIQIKRQHGRGHQDGSVSLPEISKRQGQPWGEGLSKSCEESAEEHTDGLKLCLFFANPDGQSDNMTIWSEAAHCLLSIIVILVFTILIL